MVSDYSNRNNSDYESEDDAPLSKLKSINDCDEKGTDMDILKFAKYSCDLCDFVTENKTLLSEHIEKEHYFTNTLVEGRNLRISDTYTKQDLEKSKVKINGKTLYHCHVCNKNLRSAHNFVSHQTIHSGQKNFTCEICGRKFRLLRFLKNHLKFLHSMKDEQDYHEFQNSYINSTNINKDIAQIKGSYLNYKALYEAKIVVNDRTYYVCPICGKKLSRVNYYVTHMSIHTGEKKYVCHVCGKSFRLKSFLQVHIRLTHKGIKKFSCDICHQKFGTSANLTEHIRIHTGERPHVCAKCGKRFKQKSSLFIHNRSHTDHFPFQCVQCNARFRIQSQLNYHMIKHTGERPHPCDVCEKSFAVKSHLNRHKKIHTDDRPYSCDVCKKTFRHKRNLKTHEKNCHNKPKLVGLT